jgi:hypothetical protein
MDFIRIRSPADAQGQGSFGEGCKPSNVHDNRECAEKRADQASQLEATGARILEIDFLDEPSIFEAAKQYGSGPLDILINCGGRFAPLR